ncbi:MAG: cysteinyl-tRNA synthetase [Chloroflexi bacterium]|nr:cysteinyl-tRNA synthetase [Chloroflexota bacterium]
MNPPLYPPTTHGRIALFGSGETARVGRRVHELLLAAYKAPVPIAVIETPAGFQPNTHTLALKVQAFFEHGLQNFKPRITIVPARQRGDGPHGTDEPSLLGGIEAASYVFAGAGSPTYAVKHLAGSRLWACVEEQLDRGATLALASAMALAVSRHTLPVYEIFKVGEELTWTPGLDLFGGLGLDLAIVPHWNNNEGGAELDTSHCYMGEARFETLRGMLPASTVILAIDEHTACVLDLGTEQARVHGMGSVRVLRDAECHTFAADETFPISLLRR